MMKYLLSEYNRQGYNAGSKARNDVIEIAKRCGFQFLPLYESKRNKIKILAQIVKNVFRFVRLSREEDYVLLQYPYQPLLINRQIMGILNFFKKFRHYKTVAIIHDVSNLRNFPFEKDVPVEVSREILFFNNFDYVICHNASMIKVMKENGCKAECVNLKVFDYLAECRDIERSYDNRTKIAIAGNMSKDKCKYLYQLERDDQITFELYGVGYEGENDQFIHYNGALPPDEIVYSLNGGFGLVWDGDSSSTCGGKFGNYLRFNNPHKLSLYIAAKLPVIIWSEAAESEFVRENGIGLCVHSIAESYRMIREMDQDSYDEMLRNVERIRNKIIDGYYLSNCLNNITEGE